MVSDDIFYTKFRNWVIGVDEKAEEKHDAEDEVKNNDDGNGNNGDRNADSVEKQKSHRVSFLVHQLDIIPEDVRGMYCNAMRAYPTSPLFLLLGLGTVGTNIARYSVVRRKSAHVKNVIRTGCFYKFLAPSRFGKGIAMGFMHQLGSHVESMRITEYEK